MDERAVPASARSVILRVVAFQLAYVLFHFAYGLFPSPFTAVFSGIDESVFQHMKIGFFAWILIATGEQAFLRPLHFGTFASSRLFGAVMAPWVFTLLWYLAPAIVGRMPNEAAEIIWANSVVLVTSFFVAKLEDRLSERKAGAFFVASSVALALLFLFLALRFTASRPWVDLFMPPS